MSLAYDVIVAGSGPAGSITAWRLARAGVRVAVLEKAALPRYKTCGGGIIGRTIQALPIDVRHVIEQDCHTAQLHVVSEGLAFTTHRSVPIVSMTMRDQFDYALLSAAQAAGAVLYQRCAVEEVSPKNDSMTVMTHRGAMMAQFLVAADGAFSQVARKVGMVDGRVLIPALEYEVMLPQERLDRFRGVARFDFGILPHGYAWAFPKQQHLSIGILSMVQRERELKRAITQYLDLLGCGDLTRIDRHGFVIPIRPRTGPFMKHRVLVVGDAAGFADPVTGEGISGALRSGQLAAQALIDGNLEEEAVQGKYTRSVTESLMPELRTGRLLARLLYECPRLRSWAFLRQGQRLSEAVTDVMAGTRTYCDLTGIPQALVRLLTPAWSKKGGDRSA